MVDAPLQTGEFARRVVAGHELETLFAGPIHAGSTVVDEHEPSARRHRSKMSGELAGRLSRRRRIPSQENDTDRMPSSIGFGSPASPAARSNRSAVQVASRRAALQLTSPLDTARPGRAASRFP